MNHSIEETGTRYHQIKWDEPELDDRYLLAAFQVKLILVDHGITPTPQAMDAVVAIARAAREAYVPTEGEVPRAAFLNSMSVEEDAVIKFLKDPDCPLRGVSSPS